MSSTVREGRPRLRASTGRWTVLAGLVAAIVLGAGVLLAGALTGRADVAALGVAPLVSGVCAWSRQPTGTLELRLRTPHQRTAGTELRAHAVLHAPAGATAARLRASGPGTRPTERLVRLGPGETREIPVTAVCTRTGEQRMFRLDALALSAGLATATDVVTVGPASVLVLPQPRPLPRLPLPPRLRGMTGPHPSRRVGDGTELHDLHPFQPGDRLRRIDWRTSARLGMVGDRLQDLYVRRTQSTAEATVVLVIDSRDDVGPDVGTWAGGRALHPADRTSLDLAREAAAALARAHLARGDRVGMEDLGLRRRPIRPAAGRRHLERLIRRIALATPERGVRARVRTPHMPAGALVVVLSTFLDDEAKDMAMLWRHTGHRVLAIDVLPEVRGADATPGRQRAFRLVAIARDDRLTALRRAGVDVVRWASADTAQPGPREALATLSRQRHGAAR